MPIRVGDHPQLLAVVLAYKQLGNGLLRELNGAARTVMNPVWRDTLRAKARTRQDLDVLVKGSRIATGNPPAFVAGSSTRPLSGGMVPNTDAPALEFGATDRNRRTTYSRQGATVTRRTRRQLPARNDRGRVVMAAVRDVAPRLTSLWVQMFVRKVYDASEGK